MELMLRKNNFYPFYLTFMLMFSGYACALRRAPAEPDKVASAIEVWVDKIMIRKTEAYISVSANQIVELKVDLEGTPTTKVVLRAIEGSSQLIKIPPIKPKGTLSITPKNIWGIEGNRIKIDIPDFSFPEAPTGILGYPTYDGHAIIEWRAPNRDKTLLFNIYKNKFPSIIHYSVYPLAITFFEDVTVKSGYEYDYWVAPVRVFRRGGARIYIEGEPLYVKIFVTDKIAPLPPPYAMYNPLTGDVIWEPCEEDDVIGYNVYFVSEDEKVRLNEEYLHSYSFKILAEFKEKVGKISVTCIDSSGNESEWKEAVIE